MSIFLIAFVSFCNNFRLFNYLIFCFIPLALFARESCGITLSEEGLYEDVTIGLSAQLDSSNCNQLIGDIQDIFDEANTLMATATPGLGFGNIMIIVDSQWVCSGYSMEGGQGMPPSLATVRVGLAHPVFGNQPWTQQPRGCGMKGDFIYFSQDWINSAENRGKRLLHEWAKFRWGAFEEYGHEGDVIHPPSFQSGQDDFVPNYCTNTILEGDFTSQCTIEKDCVFAVDSEGNSDVTSSLMAVPYLDNMEELCTSSTHAANATTKHNLLCEKRSVWEVINQHPDFDAIRGRERATAKSVSVTLVWSSPYPSLVIAYETSTAMTDVYNRYEFEKESLAQFIRFEVPLYSSIGLVSFDSIAVIRSFVSPIENVGDREALAKEILDTPISTNPSRNLLEALRNSAEALKNSKGIILVVTRCIGEYPGDIDELIDAAAGNIVWFILYPTNSTNYLSTFNDLAEVTGGQVIVVQDELYTDTDTPIALPTARQRLAEAIRQLLHMNNEIDVQQIDNNICDEEVIKCTLELNKEKWFDNREMVYIYYEPSDFSYSKWGSSSISVSGGTCLMQETSDVSVYTTIAIECNLVDDDATVTVTVEKIFGYSPTYVELVGKLKENSDNVAVSIWGSSMLTSLEYTDTTAPAIFVQPSYQNRSIVLANVTADMISSNGTTIEDISFNDNGTGADITGNDGIYSAYVLPVQVVGQVKFLFNIHDAGIARLYPKEHDTYSDIIICCGSTIALPDDLDSMAGFSVTTSVSAHIIETTSVNLPPGMIKDLQISGDSSSVLLTFTAQGEDLDYGTADRYILTEYTDLSDSGSEMELSDSPNSAGFLENIFIDSPSCSSVHYVTITSVDTQGLRSSPSNRASIYLYCDDGNGITDDDGLSAGAIAGIAIGCFIFLVLIIILIIYLCSKDKYGEKRINKHSTVTNCSCCKKEKTPEVSNRGRRPQAPPRALPIRSIHDLNTTPSNLLTGSASHRLSSDLVYTDEGFESNARITPLVPSHPSSPGEGYPNPMARIPNSPLAEGHPTDSFTYSAAVAKAGSEASLHSSSTASPMPTARAYNRNLNEIGVPVFPPRPGEINRRNFRYESSGENLSQEAPTLPINAVRHNTQV